MPFTVDPGDPIRTERLTLRPFTEGDLDVVFAMLSDPDVVRYLYDEPMTEEQARAALARKIGNRAIAAEGDWLSLAVEVSATGETVGDVMIQWVSRDHAQGEMGFVFHPDHHGRGYATEAATPLLSIAFDDLGLHRVIGRLEARNAPSARVLEKLGMRREAHLVENERVKGEWQSELVYAILDREWRQLRGAS
jgi:RimJ/RimL family protein N-acetyltransferase